MDSTDFDVGGNVLKFLEKNYPFKADEFQFLGLIRSFLKDFLTCRGKWHIQDGNLKFHLNVIQSVLRSSDLDLVRLSMDFINTSSQKQWQVPFNMEFVINDLLEKFEHLNPEVQHVYTIISNTSRSITSTSVDVVMRILQSILENTKDLIRCCPESVVVSHLKEELEAVQKILRFLRYFLHFTRRRCHKLGKLKDTLIPAESMSDNISALLYLASVNPKMGDETMKEMKFQLRFQLQKFSPFTEPNVRKIYIKALRTSKSSGLGKSNMVDELDLKFLDAIREYASEMSNKDQISSLHMQLQFFAIDGRSSEDQYKSDDMECIFWECTSAAIIDIACAVCSLSHSQEIVRIKEEYNMCLQKLLPPELPRTYKLRVKGYNVQWMFEEFTTYSASMGITTKHQYELVRDEILSLTIAFNRITAKQPNQGQKNIKLEIQRIHFNEIIPQALYILQRFFSRGGQVWINKFRLFILIKQMRKIKLELEDLEIKMRQDASGNKKASGNASAAERKKSASAVKAILEDQLRWVESNVDFTSPLKEEVKTLRLKMSFLKVLLCCNKYCCTEDGNLKVLFTSISTAFQNLSLDLEMLLKDLIKIHHPSTSETLSCFPMNMDNLLSGTLEKLRLLNPDIQGVYNIVSKSSRFITCMNNEAVLKNVEILIDNLKDLSSSDSETFVQVKEELEGVQRNLRFLRNFVLFTAKCCRSPWKLMDLQMHSETVSRNLSCLLYMCASGDKMNDHMVKEMKKEVSYQLQKLSPWWPDVREIYAKALTTSKLNHGNLNLDRCHLEFLDSIQDYMRVMSQSSSRYTTLVKIQISSLLDELQFITYLAINSSLDKDINTEDIFKDLFEHTVSVIKETGFVIFSHAIVHKNEEIAEELTNKVSNLQEILTVAKEDARKMYELYVPKSLWSNFPTTNAQGFIDALIQNLKKLQNAETNLDSTSKYQIEIIQQELPLVMKAFKSISIQPSQSEELQSLWTSLVDAAYLTEYVIDSFLAGSGEANYEHLGLFNVIEEIKKIKKGLKAVKTLIQKKPLLVLSSKRRLSDQRATTKVEIFEKEAEQIREKLINGSKKLGFLWIVGMPGIGKTTLGNSMFEHSITNQYFHVRARCTVGHEHDKKRMFHKILHDILGERNTVKDDNDDLDMQVYQCLKGQRYLIFMDDIWDISPWVDMKASLPDDENGSRIIFTSRSDAIASQIRPGSIFFHLSPISNKKSWQMLEMKLFGKEKSCPQDLIMIVDDIVVNCKGLPLTINLIAGILRETEKEKWEKVAESMKKYLFDDPQGRCKNVLQLSYHNLPDHLKPCFLYFAAFPEDVNIPTRKLILLWIAEGFVQPQNVNGRSSEDLAEDILNNLVSRNLVTVSRRTTIGGVQESCIHDLLHEFALSKAHEERFLLKIDGKANFSTSSSDCYQWFDQYRLCIYPGIWIWNQFLGSDPYAPRARTLILTNTFGGLHPNSLNFFGFNLLRILHIPHISCYYCPTMFTLIHLRFLAIRICGSEILSDIHKLQNLETLFMDGDVAFLSIWLESICSMTIKSLLFWVSYFFELPKQKYIGKFPPVS